MSLRFKRMMKKRQHSRRRSILFMEDISTMTVPPNKPGEMIPPHIYLFVEKGPIDVSRLE